MAKKNKNVSTPIHQPAQRTYSASMNSLHAAPTHTRTWLPTALSSLILLVGLCVTAFLLLKQESEVLYRSQEMSLWIPGDTFYHTFNIYPGGWLSWAGSYLTQFFYHPALGVTLLMLAWAAIMAMLAYLYKLKGWKLLLTAAVPLMLLAAFTQTGYWIYYQKLHGHMWVPTLGIGISVLAALVTHKVASLLRGSWGMLLRIVLLIPFGWFGYQVMGMWSFAGLLLVALPTAMPTTKQDADTSGTTPTSFPILPTLLSFLPLLVAGALIYFVPRLAYQHIYEQTIIGEIYKAGMPVFKYGLADICIYRKAYYLLALSFLPLLLVNWIPAKVWSGKTGKLAASAIIAAILGYGVYFVKDRWNRDQNFHIEIAMNNAIDRQDWQGALDALVDGYKIDTIAPTRAMVMMKNLALYRQGRAGNDMFNYPEGSRLQNVDEQYKYGDDMYNLPASLDTIADDTERTNQKQLHRWNIRLSQVAGKKMYYNYGKLNFCYRWCMEDAVEFGWRIDELKMMTLCAMLKGEDVVARKYINILKQTRYHREWAEKYEKFVGDHEAMRNDPELRPITYLMEYGDRLDGDNSLIEMYLLQTFANGNGADVYYQEMTLIGAMLMKDIDLFWPRFMRYATMHKDDPGFHMPRHYQEAAYLYGHLENKVDISQMPFDPIVKQTYDQFMAYNNQPNIAPLSEEEKAKVFAPQFGNTFYYFYFLRRNQRTN